MNVLLESRGPQIILSRTHPNFLVNLFKTEVPEISEKIVNIMNAAREPGSRAKIAVTSTDPDIDPVGACVGMKGSRVQNVVQELKGEKIDIIPWNVDAAKFVCNALAPAEISRVIIDEENRTMEVIVPDEYLSIAIGKRGQNVRLASKLTGWHLDVKNEASYSRSLKKSYDTLLALPGINMRLADIFYEHGLFSAEEVSTATVEELTRLADLSEEESLAIIDGAQAFLEDQIHAASIPAPEEEPSEYEQNAEERTESGINESESEPLSENNDEPKLKNNQNSD
jgi:N utilization substance protein A